MQSPYGVELLATVHWAAARDKHGAHVLGLADEAAIEHTIGTWNTRKGKLLTPRHIAVAFDRLQRQGWLGTAPSEGLSA